MKRLSQELVKQLFKLVDEASPHPSEEESVQFVREIQRER